MIDYTYLPQMFCDFEKYVDLVSKVKKKDRICFTLFDSQTIHQAQNMWSLQKLQRLIK